MLSQLFNLGLEARALQIIAGLGLGLVFGVAAQMSRFCLRRAVAGAADERGAAGAVWLTALASAVIGFGLLASNGLIDLGDHRFLNAEIPVFAVVVGGLCFGAGMVLTRGCVSRLTVLSATGNLRAIVVLTVLAIVAHATMKGVLAPMRTTFSAFSVDMPFRSVFESPLGWSVFVLLLITLTSALVWRARPRLVDLGFGALIGFIAVAGWALTSTLLFDDFDPLPVQTASFTQPWADTLFWTIASTAIPAGFGVGFIAGVLGGSFLSAASRGELQFVTFDDPKQTLQYLSGGAMMGAGGVLAGGCTVGAGISGVATGSITAMLALSSIAVGGWATSTAFGRSRLSATPA